MIKVESIIPFLTNVNKSHSSQIISDCPFCGKTKHFFLNKKTLAWDCKKCKEDGTVKKLLGKLGKLYLIEGEKVIRLNNPVLDINFEEISIEDIEKDEVTRLPIGFKKCNYDTDDDFTNYLKSRKFTKNDFDLYIPGYTELKSKYKDYALIQIINNYKLKGFVGRAIYDEMENRYSNSLGTKFANLIFGLDELSNRTDTLIICEGIFDKISITNEMELYNDATMKCVGSFGNKLTKNQIRIIKKYRNIKNFFLFYDARDSVEIMKKYSLLLKHEFKGCNVNVCYLDAGDPGSSDFHVIAKALTDSTDYLEFFYSKVQKLK